MSSYEHIYYTYLFYSNRLLLVKTEYVNVILCKYVIDLLNINVL